MVFGFFEKKKVETDDVSEEENLDVEPAEHDPEEIERPVVSIEELDTEPITENYLQPQQSVKEPGPPESLDIEPADDDAELDEGEKRGFFGRLVSGMSRTRKNLNDGFDRLIGAHARLDDEFMEELEEVLLSADIGIDITMRIVEELRIDVKKNLLKDTSEVIEFVKKKLIQIVAGDSAGIQPVAGVKPWVILVIGVNGSGKTTTIGKMTAKFAGEGKSVLLAAGDTFRAAAIEQLEIWAKRSGADFVRHQAGSDPSAVVFDAVKAAKARNHDIVIADTAGRLHNKANLMAELAKTKKIMEREIPGAPHETLLVLDATTGQNAVNQARIFSESIGITGLILTKLDGTAKGGVVISIMDKLGIPVKMIGVGEGKDDLRPFDPAQFIEALFPDTSSD